MNPLCPNCETELTDDFGLVDCKSCGAVCSIDLEDKVTVQGNEPLEREEGDNEIIAEDAVEEESDEGSYGSEEEVEEEDDNDSDSSDETSDGNNDDEDDSTEDDIFEERSKNNYVSASTLSGEDFLKDLEVFSEEATADGGHIYYDFHVTGIEGGQDRENFIETLADSRLEISEDAIREILGDASIFTLPQISFLRLTVIYKRLLSLGLEMSWSLSELQEPVSYLSEEIEEVDLYGDEESVVYENEDASEDY